MSENKTAIQKKDENFVRKLPTLKELIADESEQSTRDKSNDLMVYLNQNPPEGWLRKNPFASNSLYLPIGKVEYLLKRIFINPKIEVLEVKALFNSIHCTVRVHYFHPIEKIWQYHDGVGAHELQTRADTGSLKPDMSNVGKNAVTMAVAIAKTLAIKDACHHFGKLFASDVNRKDEVSYDNLLSPPRESIQDINNRKERERVELHIQNCNDISELEGMRADCEKHNLTNELNDKLLILYANQD